MKLKRVWIPILLAVAILVGTAGAENLTGIIVNSRTAQSFTAEAVTDEDLNTILEAGLAATSAINQQPWYFAAVSNKEIISEIKGSSGGFPGGGKPEGKAPDGVPTDGKAPEGAPAGGKVPAGGFPGGGMPGGSAKAGLGDSPVAIIIYMNEGTSSPNASFDCGLACENMFIAAKALGYGAKIVSSPTMQLNGDQHDAICEKLGVDPSYKAVAVLLIGREEETTDGTTGASVRNTAEDKVSIVK